MPRAAAHVIPLQLHTQYIIVVDYVVEPFPTSASEYRFKCRGVLLHQYQPGSQNPRTRLPCNNRVEKANKSEMSLKGWSARWDICGERPLSNFNQHTLGNKERGWPYELLRRVNWVNPCFD